jgi:hypothetical protein
MVREVEPAAPGRKEGFPFGGVRRQAGAAEGEVPLHGLAGWRSAHGQGEVTQNRVRIADGLMPPSMTCPRGVGGEVSGESWELVIPNFCLRCGQMGRTAVRCRP